MLTWEDSTCLHGVPCCSKENKKAAILHGHQTQPKSNICQLVNTGKQSWKRGRKGKERNSGGKTKQEKWNELRFGIPPTALGSTWEQGAAANAALCIPNKYRVNGKRNFFVRFYRVLT